jgi:CBS domain-containing protein
MAYPDRMEGDRVTATGWSVVWTRGDGCADLASLLADGDARLADSDLRDACIRARADLLVARKLTSFDLVSTAVPVDFDVDAVAGVVAAVGGGPNSVLAALVAHRLATIMDVAGSMVSASNGGDRDGLAERTLAGLALAVPGMPARIARVESARALVGELPPGTLLVVGAPGGSWLQRQFFGPGKQLVVGAPGGAVVVRSAPARCFQRMSDPEPIGVGMLVGDVLRLMTGSVAPVVDDGRLVGIVRRSSLTGLPSTAPVGEAVDDPVFVNDDDPVEAIAEVMEYLEHGPVPVVDGDGRLVGVV